MRKLSILALAVAVGISAASCDDYLDINDKNPNAATSVTADLILPYALRATCDVLNTYNSYGAVIGGYAANAGGYGGFTDGQYQYTPASYAGNWNNAFDNLEDYQQILDKTLPQLQAGDSSNIYYYAIARVMRAHNFQLLVDAYNDVPYSQALNTLYVTPEYDDAKTVYEKIGDELDEAARLFRRGGLMATTPNSITGATTNSALTAEVWHKLANTLKLKLMVRASGKANFSTTTFDNAGFLTDDVLLNPGFVQDNGKQNSAWNTWAYSYTGTASNLTRLPTVYALTFYDGTKLSDPGRGAVSYYQFPNTLTNQLANSLNVPSCPAGTCWYSSATRGVPATGGVPGILKGPTAGFPLFTAAESYLLQAEAAERGIISGNPATLFDEGVKASFNYLYKNASGSLGSRNPTADAAAYKAANDTYLVDYSKATTTEQKVEAIITQKWIALNFIHSHEGWNEYRRTGYPVSALASQGQTPENSFAAFESAATAPDKLPTRIPYPSSEVNYNLANMPRINFYTDKIFWAK